jgi:RNA polymerase sigma factor (sigma-70 family)
MQHDPVQGGTRVITVRTPTDTDAEVIRESQTNPDRFAVLYDRHAAHLYRYAYRRIGPQIAEDVVAETFTAAFRVRTRYDLSRADARPWLFGILTRELASHHRKEAARYRTMASTPIQDLTEGPADRVAAEVSAEAARGQLATALAALAPRDRDVLLLVAWNDFNYEEIAEALGIPVGTVRSRLNRARRKTRAVLGCDPTAIFEENA